MLQILSRLFHRVKFDTCWRIQLEWNSKGLYRSSGKENEDRCLTSTSSPKGENIHTVSCRSRATTPKKCTKTKNLHVQSCCFANLNLFLVWRSRCRRSRRLCLSFLVILSKFASCMTPARIAKRSLVLLWSYIFYWFGGHSSQPNSKGGQGETKQQPQTWPACFTGRFRHRWISKAEVPLGSPFFNLLPTTVAQGGGGGGWGLGAPPLLL